MADEPSFAEVADALSLGVPYRAWISPAGDALRFLRLGAKCVDILGVSADAVVADPWVFAALIPTADRHRLMREMLAATAERRACSAEFPIRRPGGEIRWCRFSVAPRFASDGAYCDGLIVDVTESRRLAEQLAEERRRLEQAIEITGMGVYAWERRALDAVEGSEHLRAIYGLPPGAPLTVQMMTSLIHPDDREVMRKAGRAAIATPDGGDCAFEHRIVRADGAVRWVRQHQRVERDGKRLKAVHGTVLDISEQRNAEDLRRLQMRELAHRSKNGLVVLMAMVHQAARDAGSVDALVGVLTDRIEAMARSQELASAVEGRPLPLGTLLPQALGPFDLSRFDLDPTLESLTLPGQAVIGLGLLLHELATNAVKYGALSNQTGRVQLRRGAAPNGRMVIEWRETGGPAVETPTRHGFGMRLLGAVLQGLGGRVEPAFPRDGFTARLEIVAS